MNDLWGPPVPHEVRYVEIEVDTIVGKVVRCPEYNTNTLSVYDWCWMEHKPTDRKPHFQKALRDSIRETGFRNPIVIYAFAEGDFLSFGGSRLRAARDLGITRIPAIVNDYVGRYEQAESVTPENWTSFFRDVPHYFEFTPYGVEQHYSLERNRRHTYDSAGFEWTRDLDNQDFIATEFSWLTNYKDETK